MIFSEVDFLLLSTLLYLPRTGVFPAEKFFYHLRFFYDKDEILSFFFNVVLKTFWSGLGKI